MTAYTQSFETVTPSGTTITTGNSGGSGSTAFDNVTIGGASTLASSNVQAHTGSLSLAVTPAAAQQDYVEWGTAIGTLTELWARWYMYFTALPTSSVRMFATRNGASAAASFQVGTAGKLNLFDASNSSVATGTSVVATGQWVRYECHVLYSATVGMMEAKLFNTPDSGTATETVTTGSTINTAAQATLYRFAQTVSTASTPGLYYMDDFELNTTGYPGPFVIAGTGATVIGATIRRANRMVAVREFNR